MYQVRYLSQKAAVLLAGVGLVPGGELQGPQAEVAARQRAVHEALVPARLHRLLHRLRPPLALITAGRPHRQPLAPRLAPSLAPNIL